jgi:AhpD family alkylhydroperoxidase
MNQLTNRERELVAIGAAMGSNCASCIEFHIPEARAAGLTDLQIKEAVELADGVRLVSARNALTAASEALASPTSTTQPSAKSSPCEQLSQPARRCC